jgi:outer membrane protein TolC
LPQFNVLRAEVELANARPRLIRAQNAYRIAKNNLANLLGFDVPPEHTDDIPLTLEGQLEAKPLQMEFPQALAKAFEQRTELEALRKSQEQRHEDIITARAGYKPSLRVYAGYDAHNSLLSQDIGDVRNGWITGVQLNWDIFDGMRTQGRIKQAGALYERAGIDLEDAGRRIELEVRTAFSSFRETDEVMKSQEKVVEQATEALRLANARNRAGTSTQLDVLSAQTALTEARTTQIQALHDYEAARARLERSIGEQELAPTH